MAIGFAISADGETWRVHVAAPAGLQKWFKIPAMQAVPGIKDWLAYWNQKRSPVTSNELSAMIRVMNGPFTWSSQAKIISETEINAVGLLSRSLLMPMHMQKSRREKRPHTFRKRLQHSPLADKVTFDFHVNPAKYNLVAPLTLDAACLNHVGHYAKSYTAGEKSGIETAFQHALYIVDALTCIRDTQKEDQCYVIEDPSMLSKTAEEIRSAVDSRCKERGLKFVSANGIDGLIQTWLDFPVRPMEGSL